MRSLLLTILIASLSAWSVHAQKPKPIWTASGSIDNDGDGRPDRSLDRKGFDDDGDGMADRIESTEKNDNNNDGDFDDPGETTTDTQMITGRAMAEIELEDPDNNRRIRLRWQDSNDDGKADLKEISICDTSRPSVGDSSEDRSQCGEERPLVAVNSVDFPFSGPRVVTVVNQTIRSTLPHFFLGCQSPTHDRQRVYLIGRLGLDSDFQSSFRVHMGSPGGSAVFSGPNNSKQPAALRMGPPGYFGSAFSVYPESCEEMPRSESGTIGISDLNHDHRGDRLHVLMDPIDTTYEASITDIEPVIVPHFATGADGLITYLLSIDNPSPTETLNGLIEVRGDDGALKEAEFAGEGTTSQIAFQIPPLGKSDFQTTGAGDLVVGSLRIFADGPVGAVGRFDLRDVGIAGVGARSPNASVIIPVRRVGDLSTGVAFSSAVEETTTLTFTLKGKDGKELGTTDREVAAAGHDAKFIQELFGNIVTGDFEGTLCISTSFGSFVAEALELDVNGQVFTALPVTAVAP